MNTKEARKIIDIIRDSENKELIIVSLIVLPILLGSWFLFLNSFSFFNNNDFRKLIATLIILVFYIGGVIYMKKTDSEEDKLRRARLHVELRLEKRPGHRSSFNSVRNEVNSTYSDVFLYKLIDINPEIFGRCTIKKGNKPGITLVKNKNHREIREWN